MMFKQFYAKFLLFMISLLLLSMLVNKASAQVFSQELEKYFEQFTDSEDQTELLEQLEDWLENPLDLNKASKDGLV